MDTRVEQLTGLLSGEFVFEENVFVMTYVVWSRAVPSLETDLSQNFLDRSLLNIHDWST